MISPSNDAALMQRAISLASETTGLTSPNPQVGCVITREAQILAEGVHIYDHRDHAEIAALKQAAQNGLDVSGATAYVTLEPCSHHGRTGPCADALIAARVARVVIATIDPNPSVSGQGVAKLRAAGIEVAEISDPALQQQARDLNESFAHFIQHRRPFVTLKAALSVDGKLAPPSSARTANQPHWLTGPDARAYVQTLRHATDAIITGIGTVLADDPALTDRTNLPRRRPLLRVVLDANLRTPITSQLARTANRDLLILCSATAPADRQTALEAMGAGVQRLPTVNGRINLPAVLEALANRQILSLLVEAGSQLNGAFIRQDLVDKAVLFYSETELGQDALPFADGVPSPYLFEQSLRHTTRRVFGPPQRPDACITGYLHDPWQLSSTAKI